MKMLHRLPKKLLCRSFKQVIFIIAIIYFAHLNFLMFDIYPVDINKIIPSDRELMIGYQANQLNRSLDQFVIPTITNLEDRNKVYLERAQLVSKHCHALGDQGSYGELSKSPLHRLRWLTSRKLVMCFNAKVGTSSWLQYLMDTGYPGILNASRNWHGTAERYLKPSTGRTSPEAIQQLQEFDRIILVRDPFARIASAYRDKIRRRKMPGLNRHIVSSYRRLEDKSKGDLPTFEEFVRYLVDHTPTDDSIAEKRSHRTDRHWFHYYANCAICDIHYNIIAKMETIQEDTRYIKDKFNLVIPDLTWNNHHGTNSSSEEAAVQLFRDLPGDLTKALYIRYRMDFLMFNYTLDKYLV
ncbi:unnamed protein product [Meganyctiphanes norvegica]|uniref:Carbohydrate sulfotransferase n=1 Tax=Meganyctiphanes norvegica TaxID=48144 RepID=A0AAV2SBJ0_MEGNR